MSRPSRSQLIQQFQQRIANGERRKLSRDELNDLIDYFIQDLKVLTTEASIRRRCQEEISLLEQGYSLTTLAGDYIPRYREAIATAVETGEIPDVGHTYDYVEINTGKPSQRTEHYALTHLKYDRHTYTQIRKESVERNAGRMDNLRILPVDAFIERALSLLGSDEPEQVAIALCALTGRRHTEIVAKGQFSLSDDHDFVLQFHGQQKKRGEASDYQILTLVPAQLLLQQFQRFRQMPSVASLEGLPYNSAAVRAFHTRVNTRVKRHFLDVVPALESFKSITVHRLRGCYAAIAIHYFCPEMQHEGRFLQQYLGHELGSAATQHYQHYRLVDMGGKLLRARGVKLMAHGLPAIAPDSVTDEREPGLSDGDKPENRVEQAALQPELARAGSQSRDALDPSATQPDEVNMFATIQRLNDELKQVRQERDEAIALLNRLRNLVRSPIPSTVSNPPTGSEPSSSPTSTPTFASMPAPAVTFPARPPRIGRARQRAMTIYEAIKAYNIAPDHSETWAITAGLLERSFNIHRGAAQAFLRDFDADIRQHHRIIGVRNPRGHNRHNDFDRLKQFVNRRRSPKS
jgi:integrase